MTLCTAREMWERRDSWLSVGRGWLIHPCHLFIPTTTTSWISRNIDRYLHARLHYYRQELGAAEQARIMQADSRLRRMLQVCGGGGGEQGSCHQSSSGAGMMERGPTDLRQAAG